MTVGRVASATLGDVGFTNHDGVTISAAPLSRRRLERPANAGFVEGRQRPARAGLRARPGAGAYRAAAGDRHNGRPHHDMRLAEGRALPPPI